MSEAKDAALRAERGSGVTVRTMHALDEIGQVRRLVDGIWQPERETDPPIWTELVRALTHSGNYLAGAFAEGELVGACLGFFGAPVGEVLHSHVTGVARGAHGRHIGYALKLHQRAWALDQGLRRITWTYDPLVARNANFNVAKLGARPQEYLVDFYGDLDDAINSGQGTDRMLVVWDLTDDGVVRAAAGERRAPDVEALRRAGASVALESDHRGTPRQGDSTSTQVLVQIPADIESMRRSEPAMAREWRLAIREVLGGLISDGWRVGGFSRSGWYVLERAGEDA